MRGLQLVTADGNIQIAAGVQATSNIGEVGPQDLVILALKAHQIGAVATELCSLIGSDTVIVTVQNGIPWWYFYKHGGEFDGRHLEMLYSDGVLESNIEANRIVPG